jgi:hypothetical protein
MVEGLRPGADVLEEGNRIDLPGQQATMLEGAKRRGCGDSSASLTPSTSLWRSQASRR